MNLHKSILPFVAIGCMLVATACSDYLDIDTPDKTDDAFVSSSPSETLKVLSHGYAIYRETVLGRSNYDWNDHFASDIEYYPENNSSNNVNAKMVPEDIPCDRIKEPFDALYTMISYASKTIELVEAKSEYQKAKAENSKNEWTQLRGEAEAMRAMGYFDLIRHCGDIPYGYENNYVKDYVLSSRFDIYEDIYNRLADVQGLMYKVGENGLNCERMTATFAAALLGKIALYSGGWQTIRTDIDDLYGSVSFDVKATDGKRKCAYARRSDYTEYYKRAEKWFSKALGEYAGSTTLVKTDDRSYTDNPFQRHFQYGMNLESSPEAILETGCIQNRVGQLYAYEFGRGCNGGGNTSPNKVFAAIRMVPTFYYGGYELDDKRRDVSGGVTGYDGKGNEVPYSFKPGAKTDGGICLNKWDVCRQEPYFVGKQGSQGYNIPILRVADVMLLLAEVKAELNEDGALSLVNTIRQRAFGDDKHNLSGLSNDQLKEAIFLERKRELFGEGSLRFDMIRTGKFSEKALAVRAEMKRLADEIKAKGFCSFSNGNVMPAYIWTKQVEGARLTYDCRNTSDPVEYPGWRGILDLQAEGLPVTGTAHNTAIKGLFEYYDPNGSEAAALEADGYSKVAWGITLAENIDIYLSNILPGISSADDVPCYFWAIPYEIVSQSNGRVTNGYGLPQQ